MTRVEFKEIKIYHDAEQEDFLEEFLDWCESKNCIDELIAYRSYPSSTEIFCSETLAEEILSSTYSCEEL